jgi:hypothetical protein
MKHRMRSADVGAKWKVLAIGLLLIGFGAAQASVWPAQAGSIFDYGQLPGTPASVNFAAWISSAVPPTQVITEADYNSAVGPYEGYKNGYWRVATSSFDNPPAANGQPLNVLFGGLGADSGKTWSYSFASLDINAGTTSHGTVGTQAIGACPTMLSASRDVTGMTIHWSGASTSYLVYRSLLPSGSVPANGRSNGRYDYLATVSGTTYKDTACATGMQCWYVVIPAASDGAIGGCHSAESEPRSVTLHVYLPLLLK